MKTRSARFPRYTDCSKRIKLIFLSGWLASHRSSFRLEWRNTCNAFLLISHSPHSSLPPFSSSLSTRYRYPNPRYSIPPPLPPPDSPIDPLIFHSIVRESCCFVRSRKRFRAAFPRLVDALRGLRCHSPLSATLGQLPIGIPLTLPRACLSRWMTVDRGPRWETKSKWGGKKKTKKCGARVNSISRTPCICFLIELPSLSPSCNFYGPTRTRVHAFSWQRNGNLRVNFLYRIENRFSKITALSPSPPLDKNLTRNWNSKI